MRPAACRSTTPATGWPHIHLATWWRRLDVVKVDVDANSGTAAKFQISSVPTLMLFRDGQPGSGHVGGGAAKLEKAFATAL